MYLDILLIQNLLYDYLIICGVAVLMETTLKRYHVVIGLSISLIMSFICFTFHLNLMLSFIPFLIVWIVFKPLNWREYFKYVLYFYCLSIMISGSLYSLSSFISFDLTTIPYMMVLFGLSFITTILYIIKMNDMTQRNKLTQFKYTVEFLVGHRMISGVGFVDTGNHLQDQVTREPIMMVPKSYLCEGEIESYLGVHHIKWWYTSYQVVNEKPKLVRTFRPNSLMIDDQVIKKGLIGIVEESFIDYDFLLQPDFIVGTIENKGENRYATLYSVHH